VQTQRYLPKEKLVAKRNPEYNFIFYMIFMNNFGSAEKNYEFIPGAILMRFFKKSQMYFGTG